MHGGTPATNVLTSGPNEKPKKGKSSIRQRFEYAFSIPCDPAAADKAFFEYENFGEEGNDEDNGKGKFKLTRLSWVRAANSLDSTAAAGKADTATFGGFGTWSKDDDLHQVSVHISTAKNEPYVGIQVDGGTTSNVNTKPEDIEATIPLAGEG